MTLLGLLLLAMGLWVGLHQKERAYKRSRVSGGAAYPTYRRELIVRMADNILKTTAALLAGSGLTILAFVFEPALALVVMLALLGLLVIFALWT